MKAPMYLIWSIEHKAWWKPNHRGYTQKREEAGFYENDEAYEILEGANIGDKDIPNEAMIPVEVCLTCMNTKIVQQGEHDDIRDVACPECSLKEEADMTGASNTGDR